MRLASSAKPFSSEGKKKVVILNIVYVSNVRFMYLINFNANSQLEVVLKCKRHYLNELAKLFDQHCSR